jgi:two-component system, chemotaxis family, CheB/CheR fusion protein
MKTSIPRQHIIAIGSSAGGFEALKVFFDYTPLDNVSYVIISHMSPIVKSWLAELLVKHSKLEIIIAENDMEVKSNKVYVIPNTEYLSISKGRLKLKEKMNKPGLEKTIDTFFTSLAAERGDRAVGVILSGTMNDGVIGIEAIHEAGGMVIVQDPATAKFKGMPVTAITSGCADLILAPKGMPMAIERHVRQQLSKVPLKELNKVMA